MITISEANSSDFKTIQEITYITWPDTYGPFILKEQLDYMLEKFYNDATLTDNLTNKNHHFLLAKENEICIGFASYEPDYLGEKIIRLHKIYLFPEAQGKGAGKLLISEIEKIAGKLNHHSISLNVNRFNKAFNFYKKIGFDCIGEEDIELDFGYLMEDFKMLKKLS
ncbi:MAG: GNAT family N-acetyltransferase [Flavobacteriaceae bacterium]|nr:GNAT family N-acetyltransferase [Flavobacteriaceae bacterium]